MTTPHKLIDFIGKLFLAFGLLIANQQALAADSEKLYGNARKSDVPNRLSRPVSQAPAKLKTSLQGQSPKKVDFDPSHFNFTTKKTEAMSRSTNTEAMVKSEQATALTKEPPPVIDPLSKYNVAILLDSSGSMAEADCPAEADYPDDENPHNSRLSRWQWIGMQIENFAQKTKTILPNGFSLVAFNDGLHVIKNCDEEQLADVLKNFAPYGGTMMAKALRFVFDEQWDTAKPLAVIVITDGKPTDISMVEPEIANATSKSAKQIVKVLILAVGDGADCNYLDRLAWSVNQFGARPGAVKYKSFKELKSLGLFSAIEEMTRETVQVKSPKAPGLFRH